MTTEQLIELLAADLTPVSRRRILWTTILALATGIVAAFGAMLLIFNPRAQLLSGRSLDTLLIKVLFASGVAATAALFLPQLTRPETRMRRLPKLVLIPYVCGYGISYRGSRIVSLAHLGRRDFRKRLDDMPFLRSTARHQTFRFCRLGAAHGSVDRSSARRRNRWPGCGRPRCTGLCVAL